MATLRIRALLVDGDPLERRAILRFFQAEQLPYDLIAVGSLAEAGAMLVHRTFDVAIVDQRLGDGVCMDLLPDLAGTPAVILTRAGDETVAAQGIHAGAYGFLVRDAGRRYLTLLAPSITCALARRRAEIAAAMRAHDLVRTQGEFQQLASLMWHEIVGPMATLLGTVEMLDIDAEAAPSPLAPDTRALIRQAVATATHLERLVTDVLGFYRLQSAPTLVTVDLDGILSEIVASLPASAWDDAAVEVSPLPFVSGDPARLRLLFRQLFEAAQRMRGPDPLTVNVWAVEYDDHVRVSVADTGVGMKGLAIEELSIAPSDATTPHTALGLAICRRITEQHGGRMWIESRERAGTTVHLTLPKATLPPQRLPEAAAGEHGP